jgi:hypothetical protein
MRAIALADILRRFGVEMTATFCPLPSPSGLVAPLQSLHAPLPKFWRDGDQLLREPTARC